MQDQNWAKGIVVAAFAAFLGAAAGSEPISSAAAGDLLFDPDQRAIQVSSRIDDQQRAMVGVLVPLMEQQLNQKLTYYGALAISPDEGFQSNSAQSALNHHSVAAADRAALAACNAKRGSRAASCVVAARILPKGYEPRDLSLSSKATLAFETVYARARAPKALVISARTGAYGVGNPDEAMATCRRVARTVNDCAIVIRD